MRKSIVGLLCMVMLVFNVAGVFANAEIVENNSIQIFVDGKQGVYSVSPIVKDSRVLLPLREMLVNLGVVNDDEHIIWNGQENSVTIIQDSVTVYLKVGSTNATVNQVPILLDVPPVNYQNRVYIPARFVAQSFNKQVGWDAATQSIFIGERPKAEVEKVVVSSGEEFVKALGSNKHIVLKEGTYLLSNLNTVNPVDQGISWRQETGGSELNLTNIYNLTIEGAPGEKVELRAEPRCAEVLNFKECSDITIKNITAGHTPREYECEAGVLNFQRCTNIVVDQCDLYGCGSSGISTYETKGLNCTDTVIHHCSWAPVFLRSSSDFEFENVKIVESSAEGDLIYAYGVQNVVFKNCEIANNTRFESGLINVSDAEVTFEGCTIYNNHKGEGNKMDVNKFVNIDSGENSIMFRNCKVYNNTCDVQWTKPEQIKVENTTFEDNNWEPAEVNDVALDATGKTEVFLDQDETRKLNVFLSVFPEMYMDDFNSETIDEEELIYFGIYAEDTFEEYADETGYKIPGKKVEEIILKYFNKTGIKHESVNPPGIVYENGYYIYEYSGGTEEDYVDEEYPYGDEGGWPFAQVRHVYDNGNGEYLVEAVAYESSGTFVGEDIYKPERYWSEAEKDSGYIYAECKAIVKKVKAGSGERYVILKYQEAYTD